VNGVDLTVGAGEVLAILGESGSGKSVTLRAMMRLLPPRRAVMAGRVVIAGQDVMAMDGRRLADARGRLVSMIFQEPGLALDPVFPIGSQIAETIRRHERVSAAEAWRRVRELLELVQIPSVERRMRAYPHELSGGMRQRAMIALALACQPALLLADEPTTALDATVQIQVLLLLRRLQRELGMGVIFVTHDVGVAVEIADRVAVMYAGRFVEAGSLGAVIGAPRHPYTRGLLGATAHGAAHGVRLEAIPGDPPDLGTLPPGCAFAPRCGEARAACRAGEVAVAAPAPGHSVRCVLAAAPPG
jgi:peptide/nickel transport system ATP-binding protein